MLVIYIRVIKKFYHGSPTVIFSEKFNHTLAYVDVEFDLNGKPVSVRMIKFSGQRDTISVFPCSFLVKYTNGAITCNME